MASSEELVPVLPETLPEDFKDWDGEAPPPATPVDQKEWEAWESSHSLGKNAKHNWRPAGLDAALAPSSSSSVSGDPVLAEQEKKPADTKGEGRSAAPSAKREDWEAWLVSQSSDSPAKPTGPSAKREAISSHSIEKLHDAFPAASGQLLPKQKESSGEPANETKGHVAGKLDGADASNRAQVANQVQAAPSNTAAAAADGLSGAPEREDAKEGEANAVLFSAFSSKSIEPIADENEKKSGKKWIIMGSVGVSALLVAGGFLLFPRFHHAADPGANQPVQQTAASDPQTASDSETATDAPKPAAGELSTANGPAAGTAEEKPADDKAAGNTDKGNLAQAQARAQAAAQAQAQAQMMNDQLNAPAQIPKQVVESGPPPASLGAGDANEMGGNGTSEAIFNGRRQPVVKVVAPKPITISSGVATGMLVSKTAPIYPPIAKSARVSGTVELHATISREGAVKDLSVVSGPDMLRQAAFDAVRTWRYKPYQLNNQPTEVSTTIDVVFTLGG